MDIGMPVMDGVEATRIISDRYPDARVLIVTNHDSQSDVIDCLRSGAKGYVTKDQDPSIFTTAIEQVHSGHIYVEPSLASDSVQELLRNLAPPEANSLY
jgi:two-component system response regulator DegU